MTAGLYRPVSVNRIGPNGLTFPVRASPEECAAVARRMGIPAIRSLECTFQLTRADDGVSIGAAGRLRTHLTRVCVLSAEDFETSTEDDFEIRFVPAGSEQDDSDPGMPDEIPYEGDTIDLGEAAAEQLGLALDPYPRMPGAALPVIGEDEDGSPFSALAKLAGPDETGGC